MKHSRWQVNDKNDAVLMSKWSNCQTLNEKYAKEILKEVEDLKY